MALYGPAEIARVLLVRPDVRAIGLLVMADFEAAFPGQKLFVPAYGGYRTDADQAAIYQDSLTEGFRAAAPNSQPYHTKGAALDFQVVGTTQDAARDKTDPRYVKLASIIERHGMRAGLHFSNGLPDPYHMDTGEPWAVVLAKWEDLKKKIFSLPASPFSPVSA